MLVSGDDIRAQRKHGQPFSFSNYAKLAFFYEQDTLSFSDMIHIDTKVEIPLGKRGSYDTFHEFTYEIYAAALK